MECIFIRCCPPGEPISLQPVRPHNTPHNTPHGDKLAANCRMRCIVIREACYVCRLQHIMLSDFSPSSYWLPVTITTATLSTTMSYRAFIAQPKYRYKGYKPYHEDLSEYSHTERWSNETPHSSKGNMVVMCGATYLYGDKDQAKFITFDHCYQVGYCRYSFSNCFVIHGLPFDHHLIRFVLGVCLWFIKPQTQGSLRGYPGLFLASK